MDRPEPVPPLRGRSIGEIVEDIQTGISIVLSYVSELKRRADGLQRAAEGREPLPPAPVQRQVKPSAGTPERRYTYLGRSLTRRELAVLAGCATPTMTQRLRKYSAERAVAMGAGDRARPRIDPTAVAPTAVVVKPLPAPPKQAVSPPPIPPTPSPAPKPEVAPIIPPGVKITIAPTPRGRFEVDRVEPLFSAMGPGRYLEDAR
jgi:hypothetical protein